MPTLLLSSRHTIDNQALWRAAVRRGWNIERAHGLRVPEIDDEEIVLYVESLFAPTLAQQLGRKLLDLPEDWLVRIGENLTRRSIRLTTLHQARQGTEPQFIKPPNFKLFPAEVYRPNDRLLAEYDGDMAVLISEPVAWEAEYRCFCREGQVATVSPYLRSGVLARETDYHATCEELAAATTYTNRVLSGVAEFTPQSLVIDVGQIRGRGWAVVEANAAWGSGIYGCDPDAVLDVLRGATIQPT
jgi:hypothetical protein